MTEDTRFFCRVCGRRLDSCLCRIPVPSSAATRTLLATYTDLRGDCIALEEQIADGGDLTAEDIKRLDKAVTVMKVGFKIVKKVLRARGLVGRLKSDSPVSLALVPPEQQREHKGLS